MHRDKVAKLAKILALDPNDDAAIEKMHAELTKVKTKARLYYKIKYPKSLSQKLHKDIERHSYLYAFDKFGVCYASTGRTSACFKGMTRNTAFPNTSKVGMRFSLEKLALHFHEFKNFYAKVKGFKIIECFDSKVEVPYEKMNPKFQESIENKIRKDEERKKAKLYAEIEKKQKEYEILKARLEKLNG